MKLIFITMAAVLSFTLVHGQGINPNYDSTLAKTLGADEYGMKKYVLVILKTGTNVTESKSSKDSLFKGHMSNIRRLVDQKKLIVAGPLGKNENEYRGIFILDVPSIEEAAELMETDPAIKAHLLKPDLYTWYGSAALSEYLISADKIWKLNH